VKLQEVDFQELTRWINQVSVNLRNFVQDRHHIQFEERLLAVLNEYNNQFFPSPEFKLKLNRGEINEKEYARLHEPEVLKRFQKLVKEFDLKVKQDKHERFLEKWFLQPVREEIDFVFDQIKQVPDQNTKKILTIILSRTIRSCRATTHADLATLIEPVSTTYYCSKHAKMCKPLFSIVSWWERYCIDTDKRFKEFSKLRTKTEQVCLNGNSENINIIAALKEKKPNLAKLVEKKKIKGIFSSPPYVGLIDYHEQHAYAYDLFGFERKDEQEIGAMSKRQSKKAQQDYAHGIANVLNNCRRFLSKDFDVFLVANDKYGLYPQIA
jgi:hypothetical protein